MRQPGRARGAIVVLAVAGVMTPAWALAAQSKCAAGKARCAAGLAAGLLKCRRKAMTPGKDPDPNAKGCVDEAHGTFDGGDTPAKGCVEKLEARAGNDCLTFDDTPTLAAAVEACVTAITAAVDPPPPAQTRCGAAKTRCAASLVAGVLECHQTALTPGKPTDPNARGCIDRAVAKLMGGPKSCFPKVEGKADDCDPVGNAAAVVSAVETCASDVVGLLSPPIPTTTAPTVGTTSSTSTSSTSTTSTTAPAGVACGPTGLDVTATLVYEPRIVGDILGLFMEVDYPAPLGLPGTGTASSVRQRFTNLIGTPYRFLASDVDSDGDGVDDRARTLVSSSSVAIPAAAIERIRFDCPQGTVISPADLSCGLDQLTDATGQLLAPEVAALVTCTLSFP